MVHRTEADQFHTVIAAAGALLLTVFVVMLLGTIVIALSAPL